MAGLAWLAGLSAGLALDVPSALLVPAGAAALAAVAAPRASRLRLPAAALCLALLGGWHAGRALPSLAEGPLTPYRGQVVSLRGAVLEPPRCGVLSCLLTFRAGEIRTVTELLQVDSPLQIRTTVAAAAFYGRLLEVRGELRPTRPTAGFPRVELLARRGIHEVLDYPLIRPGPIADLPPRGQLEGLRAWLEQRLADVVPGAEGQLAAGLLLGRDVTLSPELRAQLQATGTSHILAVSGFNVALVGGAALGLALWLFPRPLALALAAVAVLLYTLLVGAPASAARAALMFLSASLASAVGRLPDPLTSLVLAAAVMGAFDPLLVRDLGFQLSFAATAGLVLLGSRLTPTWRRLPRPLASALGMTVAAQVATLPIILYTFHTLSLVGPLANVLIAPALPPIMASAVGGLLAGWLPGLGALLAGATWLLGHYVLAVIGWAAGLPIALLPTGSLPLWGVIAAYGVILVPLGLSHLATRRSRPGFALPTPLVVALALLGLTAIAALASLRAAPGALRALFFDTSGDALTLVETPTGRRALVGSAGSTLAAAALAEQLPLLDRTLDLLVVTRGGERDLDGLAEIARRYPIGLVLQPASGRGEAWDRWTRLLGERNIRTVPAEPGLAIPLEDGAQLEVETIADDGEQVPSVAVRLHFGRLDLRLVGGGTVADLAADRTTVVRLGPRFALSEPLRAQFAATDAPAVVVGGRAGAIAGADHPQMRLAPAEVVELTSDGFQTTLHRPRCPPAPEPCSWP